MDPRKGNTSRKGDRRARLTRKWRVFTKRNVPSPEAPRRSPWRGNTRRSIAEDRTAACESPPSRRVSECAGMSVVCLSVGRSKSAWSANLTLCGGKDESEDQDKRKRQETNGTRLDVKRFDWFARTAPPAAATPMSYSIFFQRLSMGIQEATNKEFHKSWRGLSFSSRDIDR